MERSAADDAAGLRGSSDVALVDLPSTSGAHWANRDNETEFRRPGAPHTPFRRPPAVNSFPDDDETDEPDPSQNTESWDAFAPSDNSGGREAAWDAFGENLQEGPTITEPSPFDLPSVGDGDGTARYLPDSVQPDSDPELPAAAVRASFGVTTSPIGGPRNMPISPAAAPTSPAPNSLAPTSPAAIGEFVSGPGREIRPHRASGSKDQTTSRGTSTAAAPPRSKLFTVAVVMLSVVVLVSGAVAGVAYFSGSNQSLTSVLTLGAGETKGKVATAPVDGRTVASLEVVAATTKLTVRAQDLGDDLYKITSAEDSGTAPSPVLSNDRVQLLLSPDGDGASGNVEVLLSTKVRWALRFIGGADEQIINLTGGQVSSVDLVGGSRRTELRLSKPTGTVPVRVTGAVDELAVTSPAGSPVRVQVDSGAKTVAAGERTLRDVRPGSTLTPKAWQVKDRYDIDAAARITLLSVQTAG